MNISIVIATFNRADQLHLTLERLSELEIPVGCACEVIVVDNNSSDGTRWLIEGFVRRHPGRFRYLFESTPGKSAAMNRGIRAASGDVLVFTDDDCVPDRGWVEAIVAVFDADPALGAIGGRVELFDAADRAVTVRTSVTRTPFASPDQLFSLIPGCNMAFRRAVLDRIGLFDQTLGPGKRIAAAEDCDLLYRAFREGAKMIYAPEPVVYHNHGRKTDAHVYALNRQYVIGRGAFYSKYMLTGDRAVWKMAYWEVRNVALDLARHLVRGGGVADHVRRLTWLARGAMYGLVDVAGAPHPRLTAHSA